MRFHCANALVVPRICAPQREHWSNVAPRLTPSFFLNFPFKFVWLTYARLPNVFLKIPAILSTAPDLSFVEIRKQHRKIATISIVKPQLIICPYFGWFVTFRCVCDVTTAPTIASTAANELRWRNCPDKIHYKSHCGLSNSALFLFEVTANYFIFTIPASDTDFKNTGLC